MCSRHDAPDWSRALHAHGEHTPDARIFLLRTKCAALPSLVELVRAHSQVLPRLSVEEFPRFLRRKDPDPIH